MHNACHPVGDHSDSAKATEDERDEGEGDPAAQRELEFVAEPAPVSAHALQECLRRVRLITVPDKGTVLNTRALRRLSPRLPGLVVNGVALCLEDLPEDLKALSQTLLAEEKGGGDRRA